MAGKPNPPAPVVWQPPAALPDSHVQAEPESESLWKSDFRQAPSEDLELLQGRWSWHKGAGMETETDCSIFFPIPIRIPQRPVRIKVSFRFKNDDRAALGAYYFQDGQTLPYLSWFGHRDLLTREGALMVLTEYVAEQYAMNFYKGKLMSMQKYDRPYPGEQLAVGLKNMVVEQVEVCTVEPGELPKEFKDPEAAARLLGVNPLWHPVYRFQGRE